MSVNKVSQTDGSLAPIAGGTLYADEPIGTILPFGGSAIPNGFLLCNGAAVSRTTYAALFAVIGTSFGSGDGSTTFNIPDMREVVPVGAGTSTRSEIATHDTYSVGGFKDDQVQDHSHNYSSVPQDSTSDLAIQPLSGGYKYGNKHSYATTTNATGRHGSTTHGKQLGVNYIIKAISIALPTDFGNAVDDKITANMIDSVTDGSQKAITSNAVFDQLKNFCMTVQASGSLTIDANSQQGISLTYTCPQGYTPILAVPRSAGSWAWVWSYCYLQDTSHVYAVIRSVNNFQETQTITANVLCVRTYS